jgi:hypothetical protein
MTHTDPEAAIRQHAYQLWEQAGRPHGADLDHWLQAEVLVRGGEAIELPVAKPKRARKAVAEDGKPARARKAAATA